jgi:uncharacterized membrane protein YkoI
VRLGNDVDTSDDPKAYMRLRVIIPVAVSIVLTACSLRQEDASARSDVVRSKEDAIKIAKSTWGSLDLRGRLLHADLDDGKWVVQRAWHRGDPTEEAVIIDARTGRAKRSSTEVTVLDLNRR